MKILICNERFTFRFGVDRVLILLAQGLKKKGHKVGIAANRADSEVIAQLTETYFEIPQSECPYIDLNEFTAEWLRKKFDSLPSEELPDVVLIGGWPFLAAIPVFLSKGVRVVFHDFGVVPLDAYSGAHLEVLQKLQTLRQRFIPLVDITIAISSFIKNTQSTEDSKQPSKTAVGLLGADHMSLHVWKANELPASTFDSNVVAELRKRSQGQQWPMSILNLGRWEPSCYKNSEAVFDLVDKATEKGISVVVFVLADRLTTMMPSQYVDKVIPVGFPDDAELTQLMEWCDMGISTSLWEGFNLPLAEMQWCGKPVLVFNAGAHPEVVAHPWQLCRDVDEMVGKVSTLRRKGAASIPRWTTFLDRFRNQFRWEHVIDQYERLLVQAEDRRRSRLFIMIDVTNAARDTANSGVIRVTRRICRELQEYCRSIFVIWDSSLKEYVFPNQYEYRLLSQYNGPDVSNEVLVSSDGARLTLDAAKLSIGGSIPWLLLTETVMEAEGQNIRPYARHRGFALAAVFYDAIPVLRPDLVKDIAIRDNHALYMRGLAKCDLVLPISEFSASCLLNFWEQEKLKGSRVVPLPLPGEFAAAPRCSSDQARASEDSEIHILCVSTLEPRKNHLRLLDAINKFARKNPDIRWTLTLIGNQYAGAEDIAVRVQTVCAKDKRIRWLGVVDDERLAQEYQRCSFTVYASEIEGFGMPVLESLWFGKPVICHNRSVLAELAVDGGCLTVDMTNQRQLVDALETIAKSPALRARLSSEAQSRSIKRWDSYIAEIWDALCANVIITPSQPVRFFLQYQMDNQMIEVGARHMSWSDFLYEGCLTNNWQMNDSERMSLLGILSRLRPECAIEIGTYKGGSLSLISQYARSVISIDIDPTIPAQFSSFKNVEFFTGDSAVILPMVLENLSSNDIAVEFILIDGDHSTEGVKRDIEIILSYVPKKPLVLLMHDGFNPACRKGMLEANWQRSPYLSYVDVDFVPGRMVEYGGGSGEMWGGLAMAYFSPVPRVGDAMIGQSSLKTFEQSRQICYPCATNKQQSEQPSAMSS